MLNIGIYAYVKIEKKIRNDIEKYLLNKKIPFTISKIKTSTELNDFLYLDNNYQIIIICKNNNYRYVKKTYFDYNKSSIEFTSYPFVLDTKDNKIYEDMFSNYLFGMSDDIYIISNKQNIYPVNLRDIEYVKAT